MQKTRFCLCGTETGFVVLLQKTDFFIQTVLNVFGAETVIYVQNR